MNDTEQDCYVSRVQGSFILSIGYVRTRHYSIKAMEERENAIRIKAEEMVNSTLSFPKRVLFNWVLFHARRGVKHRENTRFARTKMYGLFRSVFRAIGTNLVSLGLLKDRQVSYYICEVM